MRLLDSDEANRNLRTVGCFCARDPLAEFPIAFAGIAACLLIALGAGLFSSWAAVAMIAGVFLVLWSGFFVWRATFTIRHWVVAITSTALCLRLWRDFSSGLGKASASSDSSVLELPFTEVVSLCPGVIDITWSSIRETTVECLFIEPLLADHRIRSAMVSLESFHGDYCGDPKLRLVIAREGHILLMWSFWRPPLKKFLNIASGRFKTLQVGKERKVTLDLRDFILKPAPEQRAMLLFLKQLGFGPACAMMLKRRMRMSSSEAAKLMRSL